MCPADETNDSGPFFFHSDSPSSQGGAELTSAENAWGRFALNSWVRYQITVTARDGSASSRSVTEVRQTLEKIDDQSYTIQRSVSVRTGAQELVRRPELITYNFYDRAVDHDLVSTIGSCENIAIKGPDFPLLREVTGISRVVPCYVRIFSRRMENRREETKIWYSPVVFPYLLKQQSRVFVLPDDENGEETLYRSSTTEIWKSPVDLRLGLAQDWVTSTTETDATGRIRAQVTTFHSSQIPGGISGETAIEYNQEGKEILRSESRLLDYYAALR